MSDLLNVLCSAHSPLPMVVSGKIRVSQEVEASGTGPGSESWLQCCRCDRMLSPGKDGWHLGAGVGSFAVKAAGHFSLVVLPPIGGILSAGIDARNATAWFDTDAGTEIVSHIGFVVNVCDAWCGAPYDFLSVAVSIRP